MIGRQILQIGAKEIAQQRLRTARFRGIVLQAHADVGEFHRLLAPLIQQVERAFPYATPQ